MTFKRLAILAAGAVVVLGSVAPLWARRGQAGSSQTIQRGKYLVECVGMCIDCHTPMKQDGTHDATRALQGAVIGFKPAAPIPGWAPVAPGIVPASAAREQEIVRLLETGLKPDGKAPGPPMPPYRLTHADAVAVAAYLRSLAPVKK